jgi:hypothetical protein
MDSYDKLLKKQAKTNRKIFWDIDNIDNLSREAIVERILLYGSIKQFKKITKNKEHFKRIYKNIRQRKRNSLTPLIINYVDLYLEYNG